MLDGETVGSGAPTTCEECNTKIDGPKVMLSGGGYYIGFTCECGPYSRESAYTPNRHTAEAALKIGSYSR